MITRRQAMARLAGGALLLALPGCRPVQIDLAALLDIAVAPVGEAWLKAHPEDANLAALIAALLAGDPPADATAWLAERIAADFRSGAVEDIRGWQLSRTECRLCAVVELTRAADQMFSGMPMPELEDRIDRVQTLWRERLSPGWMAALGVAGVALGGVDAAVRKKGVRIVPLLVMLAAMIAGLGFAWGQLNLLDDAFVSFCYARNLVEGNGLVFIPGERVEGYTNFLWTVLLAAGSALTGADIPRLALALCGLCYLGLVRSVYRIGQHLHGNAPAWLPLAAGLLAINHIITAFASSGLETIMGALWVSLGLWAMVSREDARGAALCGLAFIAATLTRPDHALFYASGAAVIAARCLPMLRRSPDAIRIMGAYAAPFVLWLAVAVWRLSYYGSLLPNTYYMRSADQWYASQGLVYALSFYLGSHGWLLALLFAAWLLAPSPDRAHRDLKRFSLLAVLLYNVYVVKVGGDFMYGRFYVSLLPIMLLGAEGLVAALWRRSRRLAPVAALLAVGLLVSTTRGLPLLGWGEIEFDIADEATIYEVSSLSPLRVEHMSFRVGNLLGQALEQRDIRPTLATCCVGMIAWYSKLPVVDLRGLTDATVAHTPIEARARPGHEKWATDEYVLSRNIHLARWPGHPRRFDTLTRLRFVPDDVHPSRPWRIVHYDRALMRRIAEEVPELAFTDFEVWLDEYIADLESRSTEQIAADLAWFDTYYFDQNDDPERRAALTDSQ